MTGKLQFAVDTSYVIAVLRGDARPTHPMELVAFPVPVVGELCFGALASRDAEQKLAEINAMVASGTILTADLATAHVYAELRARLKAAGTPLPENDIWIAASCLQHDVSLLTRDEHFKLVPGLRITGS